MKTSQTGLDLIEEFEGFRSSPYLDSKGIPTIGIGTTHYENNVAVTMNDASIDKARADALLAFHLIGVESCLNNHVTTSLSQNQFDALADFIYNEGQGNFLSSTLLKDLNAGNFDAVSAQLLIWDKAGGQELSGLERRRVAEQALFNQA